MDAGSVQCGDVAMTYAEAMAVAETRKDLPRQILSMDTFEIVSAVVLGMAVVAIVWLVWIDIRHSREMKRRAKEQAEREIILHSFGSDHYQPTVTGDRQIVNGVEFVRMGPPTEWRD